jgi:hypothetical protein
LFCQSCGAVNPSEQETCHRCGNKLLVMSGVTEPVESAEEFFVQAQEDLEEHLLERISALEDGVRRLSQALASAAQHLSQLGSSTT